MPDNTDAPPSEDSLIVVVLRGLDRGTPSVLDFSRFLYQTTVLYEISRLVADPRYSDYRFPHYTFAPQRSRLQPPDRLAVASVRRQSPWELVTFLSANPYGLVSVGLFVMMLGKGLNYSLDALKKAVEIWKGTEEARNARLDRRETVLRIEKLEREEAATRQTQAQVQREANAIIQESDVLYERRKALRFRNRSINTLRRLGFKATDLDVRIVRREEIDRGKE